MSLFQRKDFISHAGLNLKWKIECDDLTNEDWETLALIVSEKCSFGKVIGIPTGGLKLATALEQYKTANHSLTIIVDDVLTTGKSMYDIKMTLTDSWIIGIVAFSRMKNIPSWIYPIFQIW